MRHILRQIQFNGTGDPAYGLFWYTFKLLVDLGLVSREVGKKAILTVSRRRYE